MVFAVEEINRNPFLLPGVKLGYRILDSCARYPWTLLGALSLISYQSSCPCLSDKHLYHNFFRTIPSDVFQAKTMAELAKRFHWSWVFEEEVRGTNVCVAFLATFSRSTVERDMQLVATKIQGSTANVILIFAWYTDAGQLLLELARRNVTDRQFLASEAWSTSGDLLSNPALFEVARGVLGVAIRSAPMPGFDKHLQSLHPSLRPDDGLLRELWERQFGCSPKATHSDVPSPTPRYLALNSSTFTPPFTPRTPGTPALPHCSGEETLNGLHTLFTDTSHLRVTYNVYLAVYAAAHALHSLLSCPHRDSSRWDENSTCSTPENISPLELLQQLSSVNFTTQLGEEFFFRGADIPAVYDLVNWQVTPQGSLNLVLIGRVEDSILILNQSAIQWNTGFNQVPVSVCSESCPPGSRVSQRKGEPVCCFDCIPCAEGQISNETGSLGCDHCPAESWSNVQRTSCIPRQIEFLSFNDTMGVTLTTAAICGAMVTGAVFAVFLYYRHTPLVRANNSELSFLLLLSLKLCFLCSLVFIGQPSVWSCKIQQAAFGVSFALCLSCVLVKTIVVLAAFRSARPGAAAQMRWFGPVQQRGCVCLITCIQVIICVVWLALNPPVPHRDLGFKGATLILECAVGSLAGFFLVLGYIGLLAFLCLLLAFLARKLPDNFNEAKLITFSMLIFCAVWVTFVPAYISSPGKYTVAVEIFAILASSYGLLICIFAPKCFIILLRPAKNTKKYMMSK
ncbi:olfactory receptor CR1 [Aplochiton taeniatus]